MSSAADEFFRGAKKFSRRTDTEEVDGRFYRRRLEWDPDDSSLTEIADERMTSGAASAQTVKGCGNFVCLSMQDVRWLHRKLGELVAHWDRHGI